MLPDIDHSVVISIYPGENRSRAGVLQGQLSPCLPHWRDAAQESVAGKAVETIDDAIGVFIVRKTISIEIVVIVDFNEIGDSVVSGDKDLVLRVYELSVFDSGLGRVFPEITVGVDEEALGITSPEDILQRGSFDRAGIEVRLIQGSFTGRGCGQHGDRRSGRALPQNARDGRQ